VLSSYVSQRQLRAAKRSVSTSAATTTGGHSWSYTGKSITPGHPEQTASPTASPSTLPAGRRGRQVSLLGSGHGGRSHRRPRSLPVYFYLRSTQGTQLGWTCSPRSPAAPNTTWYKFCVPPGPNHSDAGPHAFMVSPLPATDHAGQNISAGMLSRSQPWKIFYSSDPVTALQTSPSPGRALARPLSQR